MPAHLEFDLRFSRPEAPRRRPDGSPMRLLLLGNFSGRAAWVADDAAAEPHWVLHRVDIDNLSPDAATVAEQLKAAAPPDRESVAPPAPPVVNVTVPPTVVNIVEAPDAPPRKTRKTARKLPNGTWVIEEMES